MKIVLITGCAGFIGSNLVSTLLKKKFKIIGIDNLSTGKCVLKIEGDERTTL